jgi:hypothetical protein
MLRTFFSGLGLLFAALIVFCASYVGNLAAVIDDHGADYQRLAVDVTRELSRSWSLADIEKHYTADAREELAPALQPGLPGLDNLKPLGVLLYADDVRVETLWSHDFRAQVTSPGAAAERLSQLINRAVRVTFVGKFAGGLADVTVELKREAGVMKLWRLRVDSREKLRREENPGRRVISHA